MSAIKATVRQTDLTRMLKAWKAAWGTPPAVHVQPDGTVVMMPSDASAEVNQADITPFDKWKSDNEAS
ncbi:hypothetical protein [Sulfitobacter guttiformis]|nr:hypothetical protein [Sulfitobacter guttiformis]